MHNKYLRKLFSKLWKQTRLRWLPKISGRFRPISLLPTLGKLLDRVVNTRLTNWYEREERMNRRQLGFPRARSTVGAQWDLDGYKERNCHVLLVTLNLKNAFNMGWPPYVDHAGGLRELAWDFLK